jgi:hypothetical protein
MTPTTELQLRLFLRKLNNLAQEQDILIDEVCPNHKKGFCDFPTESAFQELWVECKLGHQFNPLDLVGKLLRSTSVLLEDLNKIKKGEESSSYPIGTPWVPPISVNDEED